MDIEIIKAIANFGAPTLLAVLLIYLWRESERLYNRTLSEFLHKQEELIRHLVKVIESNTQALIDVKIALSEMHRTLEDVLSSQRRLEEKISRLEGKGGRTF